MKQLRNSLILLLTAIVWGLAFVAQSEGLKSIGVYTFNGIRMILGAASLVPIILVLYFKDKEHFNTDGNKLWIGGLMCGMFLFLASTTQAIGLKTVSAGKSGFLTALYIIIVPLIGIFAKKKIGIKIIIASIGALAGLYLLCFEADGTGFGVGDAMLIVSAFLFAFHIIVIDKYSPYVNGVALSAIQFTVCGILSLVCMVFTEAPTLELIRQARNPILYAGVMSCGVGYTLQIIGQKGVSPAVASIILSLESVFALLGEIGFNLILGNPVEFTLRYGIGCLVMFASIVLTQIPDKRQ